MDQLLTGVRYLDIRPCIVDRKYWVCHGTFVMQPLENVITDIKDFLDNTMEIVIVNFKEFPRGKSFICFIIFRGKKKLTHFTLT